MRKGTWTAVVVVVIIVAAAIIYAVVHQPATTPAPTSSRTSTQTQIKSQPSNTVIETESSARVGQYLADTNGNALYTYGGDTQGKSNCEGSCLYSWPVYSAAHAPGNLPANVSVITRSDGSKQYAYKGLPLYTFTGDSRGQVTGDGISNFHVAKP